MSRRDSVSARPREPLKSNLYTVFEHILLDDEISAPVAAILSLTDLIEKSQAETMFELMQELEAGIASLEDNAKNPIGLTAGCALFREFVSLFTQELESFSKIKIELVRQGRQYAEEARNFREKIATLAIGFIKDDSVILTHSYSRVVIRALLYAHKRKRISVYVTEARPRGLGLKTYDALTRAGIPCTVILDSAVAYVMDKVDIVLVGSEAVVESGGLINAVGSNQMALLAKAVNKPFYALAESYKFHRLFPLSQFDLPTHTPDLLAFPHPQTLSEETQTLPMSAGAAGTNDCPTMTSEQIARNPTLDYTRPDLISLVFSDVGILTPEGVSQYLVGMFAG